MFFFKIAILLALVAVVSCTTSKEDALITSLPRVDFDVNFKQYAGYVTVEESTGRNIFYWFVESQGNPSTDPLVFWTNGGPGCSSMMGMLEEHGPFLTRATDADKRQAGLKENFFAWNKVANVLYVDHPVGVGFSYSNNPRDYITGDNATAEWTALFIQKWLEVYTEYADRELWITGESYGGVYVPTIANQILTNTSLNPQLAVNLKKGGLMLGNPVTYCEGREFAGEGGVLNMNDQVQMYYWHGMVSPDTFGKWQAAGCDTANPNSLATCISLNSKVNEEIGPLRQPLMKQGRALRGNLHRELAAKPLNAELEMEKLGQQAAIDRDCLYYSFCVGNATLRFTELLAPDCFNVDEQINSYLNDPEVQAALHAKPMKWVPCSSQIEYDRGTSGPITNYLEEFFRIAPTMRILYYSGDIDIATVPFGGTFRCLMTMNRDVVTPWRPYTVNNEIAGYIEEYQGYSLATVKAAGHEAPAYQPASSYAMFTSFLQNKQFPE